MKKYREEVKADPNVCFVRTPGARTLLEDQCRQAGITADAFQFTGDYYCAAEPGAALVSTLEAGSADGNPRVPAAGSQTGLSGPFPQTTDFPVARQTHSRL